MCLFYFQISQAVLYTLSPDRSITYSPLSDFVLNAFRLLCFFFKQKEIVHLLRTIFCSGLIHNFVTAVSICGSRKVYLGISQNKLQCGKKGTSGHPSW